MMATAEQRGLCGCETCEFMERRQQYEADDDAEWCECASCCRMFDGERNDYYVPRLRHRGLNYHRTEYQPTNMHQWGNIEKELADLWERECSGYEHSDLSWPSGDVPRALLQSLLRRIEGQTVPCGDGKTMYREQEVQRLEVTQDIATACAEVVQWFGSNCGIAFLMKAFQRAGYSLSYQWAGKQE